MQYNIQSIFKIETYNIYFYEILFDFSNDFIGHMFIILYLIIALFLYHILFNNNILIGKT